MKLRLTLAAVLAVLLVVPSLTAAAGKSIDKLVAEHGKALADCDADALVAGYTADATLFFPDGVIVKGRAALRDLYDGFVKAPEDEGLCGLVAKPADLVDERPHDLRQVQGHGAVPGQAVLLDRRLRLQGQQDRRRGLDLRRDQTHVQEIGRGAGRSGL